MLLQELRPIRSTKWQYRALIFPGLLEKIQLQLQAEQPMTLSSDEDDADVRRVLTFVISNSDRFDAGVRLDCVEALRGAASMSKLALRCFPLRARIKILRCV